MNAFPQTSTAPAVQPLTAAAVPALLPTLDLTPHERRDFASAVATLVSVAGHPAEAVLLDCSSINGLLYRAPARVLGLSPDRLGEVASLLRRLLRLVGLHAPLVRGTNGLTPAWKALHDALGSRFRQMPLIDFLRFCSQRSVAPAAVTSETLVAFENWCLTAKIEDDIAGKGRRVAANWTWARAQVPGWPDVALIRPSMREQYTRPLSAYPAPFVAAVKRFTDSLACKSPGTIFSRTAALPNAASPFTSRPSGRSRRRALRPRTIETRVQGILFAAAALPLEEVHDLRDLVCPVDRVERILTFHIERLQKRRGEQAEQAGRADLAARATEVIASAHLANIAEVLRQIARFHCDPPLSADDIAKITEWARLVTPAQQTTMTPKNRERLRRLIQPDKVAMLLHLPRELLRRAAETEPEGTPKLTPKAAATKALYALALELVLVCPMRRDNLAKLRLDTHLKRANTRGRPITDLWIDAREVKNGREICWPLPEGTARMIQEFIDRHRPVLLDGSPNDHLFPGARGQARNTVEFGTALGELITGEIGAEINVHLLRHFAAWRYLKKHPGAYEIVRLVLGHASTKTVIAAYAGLEADAAATHFAENLLEDRRDTQATAAALFGKRRGRPPGSKNKPKAGGTMAGGTA